MNGHRRQGRRGGHGVALAILLWGGLVGASAQPAPVAPSPSASPSQSPVAASAGPATPPEDRRGAEQTLLTFPEWFLVFSPAELADYLRAHTPDDFPFMGHVRQFWSSYATVRAELKRGHYAPNPGYHVMIVVIGASTTIEYGLKELYETLVGRLTALGLGVGELTAEDRFAARVQQDYVDFIRVRPWYEYPFTHQLAALWRELPWWGPHVLRKWERRYALSTEFLVKAGYGWLIGIATHASYDTPSLVTAVRLDHLPAGLAAGLPGLKPLATVPGDGADGPGLLATVPRYQAFTRYAAVLAGRDVRFTEVAGNRSDILLTALVDAGWRPAGPGPAPRVLFSQPVLTRPATKRVALLVPVAELSATLRQLRAAGVEPEHVFDY